MILPRIISPEDINKHCKYIEPDVPTNPHIKNFHNYPYDLDYKFNNRGLRDIDWVEDLQTMKESVWVVGDSGSSGIGIPFESIWPRQLTKMLDTRIYNASKQNSCNVEWMFANAKDIINTIAPKLLIIQWTWLWRNNVHKKPPTSIHVINKMLDFLNTDKKDSNIIITLIKKIEEIKQNTNIIHVFVPWCHDVYGFLEKVEELPLDKVYSYEWDLARDEYHYGVESHRINAENIFKYINEKNINYR